MNLEKELQKYLDSYLKFADEDDISFLSCGLFSKSKASESACLEDRNIEEYINDNKDNNLFQTLLFRYIDRTNLKDSEIYNRVNMDRRLFSKIRNENYHPSKETVILLGLALELNEDELEDLLASASYSMPKNNEYDLIIRFCFINKIYDVIKVNTYLDNYGYKTLN